MVSKWGVFYIKLKSICPNDFVNIKETIQEIQKKKTNS